MAVHRSAARGFQRGAGVYERARPSYPAAAVDHIVEVLGLRPGRRLLELGAGTGKLTRLLAPAGAEVLAVEPVAGMRDVLATAVPGVEVVDGSAEAVPLDDRSVDAVVAAQAFHWFDGDAALREIARVLRPGGTLVLVWNSRDHESALARATDAVLDRYRGDTPSHYSGAWRACFERTGAFTPLDRRTFPNPYRTDRATFVERFLSVSMIAALDDEERGRVADELSGLVAGLEEPFDLPQDTLVYWCSTR